MKPDDAPAEPVSEPAEAEAPPTRRRFSRVAVDLPAQYAIGERPQWDNCTIVNISGGGLRLQTLQSLAGGTSVSIRFEFDRTPVVAQARIVDSTFDRPRGSFFSSAAFTSIDAGHQQKIEQCVIELRAAQKP
jgi:c-di-GMP-binding flagellar brake protein YcgR